MPKLVTTFSQTSINLPQQFLTTCLTKLVKVFSQRALNLSVLLLTKVLTKLVKMHLLCLCPRGMFEPLKTPLRRAPSCVPCRTSRAASLRDRPRLTGRVAAEMSIIASICERDKERSGGERKGAWWRSSEDGIRPATDTPNDGGCPGWVERRQRARMYRENTPRRRSVPNFHLMLAHLHANCRVAQRVERKRRVSVGVRELSRAAAAACTKPPHAMDATSVARELTSAI